MRQTKPIRPFQFTYRRRRYTLQRGRRTPIMYFGYAGAHHLVLTGLTASLRLEPGLRQRLLDCANANHFRELLAAAIRADASEHYSESPLMRGLAEHGLESLPTRTLRGLVRSVAGTPRPRGHAATLNVSPSVFTDKAVLGLLDDWIVPQITAQILHGMEGAPDPEAGNLPLDTVIH